MAMYTPVVVLQSAKPEDVDAWKNQYDALVETFSTGLRSFEAEMNAESVYHRRTSEGLAIAGWKPSDPAAPLPEGWRKERDSLGLIVPALRSKAGKDNAARLEAMSVALPAAPGLPDLVWGEGYVGRFRVERLNGRWYASLGFHLRADDSLSAQGVDMSCWFQTPMSRYYSDRELMESIEANAAAREKTTV